MNIEILNTLEIKKNKIDYHNKKYNDIITANPEFYIIIFFAQLSLHLKLELVII